MIIVNVFRKKNKITAFEISGHADSGPYGYDLVCAGVSAVSFGSVNAIHLLCDIDLVIEQADDGGFLQVLLPDLIHEELSGKAQLLLEAMLISLKTIEHEYNQFVRIEDK